MDGRPNRRKKGAFSNFSGVDAALFTNKESELYKLQLLLKLLFVIKPRESLTLPSLFSEDVFTQSWLF